jgi:hypothetical protein
MLKDGTYAVWFKTPLGHGTGIAHLADEKMCGRDSIMSYNGTSAKLTAIGSPPSQRSKDTPKDMQRFSAPTTPR